MFFKTLYIFILVIMLVLAVGPILVLAQTNATISAPPAPGWASAQGGFMTFLQWLFPVMIAAAAVVATLSIIFAGFQWMAGAISPPQVEAAKNRISAAVLGLAIALTSWIILNTINPVFVKPTAPVGFTLQCPSGVCPSWSEILFGTNTEVSGPPPQVTNPGSAAEYVLPPKFFNIDGIADDKTRLNEYINECRSKGGTPGSPPNQNIRDGSYQV